jgi:hypothetical protein
MNKAKIRLSQKETELITNAEFILTKNAILEKVKQLLAELQEKQQSFLQHPQLFLEEDEINLSSKISKGENYKGLPYLILDYPRIFSASNTFAVRTMFWWGHSFSTTLHLSGNYKKRFEEKIITSLPSLISKGFFYCVNESPWEHDFETSNYLPLTAINKTSVEKSIRDKPFIKLAIKIPLHQWDDAPDLLFTYFREIIEMLAS